MEGGKTMEEMKKFLLWSITVSEILRRLDLWYWNMSRQEKELR